jgi:hypothetical protein
MKRSGLKQMVIGFLLVMMATGMFSSVSLATDVMEMGKEQLSEKEIEGILLMREEEKLARDVYLTLGEKWNVKTFFNIARSEQKHMDEMGTLVEKYELEDPIKDDSRGSFTSPEMQKLYNELVEEGSKSKLDALKVGALVEDLDIADLESLLKETDNNDIRIVYLNLVKGSRNHLRTFDRQIDKWGGSYQAKYITPEMYKSILDSPKEQYEISDPDFKYNY